MEQKQSENEEYISRKNAEIAELEEEQERTLMNKFEWKDDGKPTVRCSLQNYCSTFFVDSCLGRGQLK